MVRKNKKARQNRGGRPFQNRCDAIRTPPAAYGHDGADDDAWRR